MCPGHGRAIPVQADGKGNQKSTLTTLSPILSMGNALDLPERKRTETGKTIGLPQPHKQS